MPRPFKQLTLAQFSQVFQQFQFQRQIDSVHMHHTWRPNRSMYKGLATIEAMYEFHTIQNGWSDIAQHISIAPDGTIWTGRNWNDPPASAIGYNGSRTHGPFMFEMIGDFDQGKDPFDGPQRDTAIAVVALVQQRFNLPLDSLRFHNQMTNLKTCPGSSINRSELLQEVQVRRQSLVEGMGAREIQVTAEELVPQDKSSGVRDQELLAEPEEEAMSPRQARFYSGEEDYIPLPLGSRTFEEARGFNAQDLSDLRPYVVSMRQGQWDTNGIFNSTAGDVDALFFEHAEKAIKSLSKGKKFKFVIYAHGGLVSEQHGLEQAQTHINWWKQNAEEGIYPLYFVWKTGLAETIGQLLGFASGGARGMAVAREAFTDPVVAAIARRLGGEAIWSAMKRDAEQAVLNNGVATYVAKQMKKFCDQHAGRVELHAVGHSAGSVFHSHYIPMSTVTGNPYFTTTSLMAPAVRVDTFMDMLTQNISGSLELKPEVGHLAIFTMKKDYEKRDDCAGIYRQSLLYLIYHAFEPNDKTPILGLEECIRADKRLAVIFGLGGNTTKGGEVIWSPTVGDTGRSASRAIHHGDFSSDAPSLNSILRRVLDVGDTDPIHNFPSGARALGATWDIWAPPDDLPGFSPSREQTNQSQSIKVQPAPAIIPTGNRRALCVGIDSYASPNRLTGCVHDARAWSEVLAASGFSINLLLDQQATYDSIMSELRTLVASSRSGDVIVFQYSGHGTTAPDQTGRTIDGVEEAMVPVDFSAQNPRLLMDFELASIFNTLPAGVNLTCFIDCCHSGTITRLLVGLAPQQRSPGRDERPRFITLTQEEIDAVKRYRSSFMATARGNTLGGPAIMHDVVFSACKPEEVAWEVDRQGEFTRYATQILRNRTQGMTNEQFSLAVVQAFGATPRQHPMLDCAPAAKSRILLDAHPIQ